MPNRVPPPPLPNIPPFPAELGRVLGPQFAQDFRLWLQQLAQFGDFVGEKTVGANDAGFSPFGGTAAVPATAGIGPVASFASASQITATAPVGVAVGAARGEFSPIQSGAAESNFTPVDNDAAAVDLSPV